MQRNTRQRSVVVEDLHEDEESSIDQMDFAADIVVEIVAPDASVSSSSTSSSSELRKRKISSKRLIHSSSVEIPEVANFYENDSDSEEEVAEDGVDALNHEDVDGEVVRVDVDCEGRKELLSHPIVFSTCMMKTKEPPSLTRTLLFPIMATAENWVSLQVFRRSN